jgi:alpha-D-xyloside xylohydrolase
MQTPAPLRTSLRLAQLMSLVKSLGLAVAVSGLAACGPASPQAPPPASRVEPAPAASAPRAVDRVVPSADGATIAVPGGFVRLQICTAAIVRVAFAKDASFFARPRSPSLITAPKRCEPTPFQVASVGASAMVATQALRVSVDGATGAVAFSDAAGQPILAESAGGRSMVAADVQGEATHHVRQEWEPNAGESLYGLGQHQQGLLDIKGAQIDLRQYNTEVAVPFFVSSRGYGVLWDNPSYTRFGDLGDAVPIPGVTGLYAPGSTAGDVAATDGAARWSGTVVAPASGDYLFRTFSTGGIHLEVGGKTVIDHWRQDWLPNDDVATLHMNAGEPVPVALAWTRVGRSNVARLLWKPPPARPTTSLWSEVGDGTDYWFVYGPELDDVVAGYRRLTGAAVMPPRWIFGLWQSRERYTKADEVTDVLRQYRSRGAPIDNIVQDWQYWPQGTWGSHDFDPARFPDPAGWLQAIHEKYHAQLMISVWPRFYPETANYKELEAAGLLYPLNLRDGMKDFLGHPFAAYDAFNPAARRMYWAQIDRALFSRKIDAWWLDASEPEVAQGPFDTMALALAATEAHMSPTAMGTGARVLNAYPLVHSQGVYEGQRSAAPDQRVFILTRSGFAGQQRYGAATWSGDITSTWTAMKKQIPAGLGFSISGVPYWTLDTGGFVVPDRFSAAKPAPADLAEWYELNTRWFEYSTFLPILRLHGQKPLREIWEFGGDSSAAYRAMLKFDKLRYRLLPYLYSLAGGVTQRGGTILRPLVMDFRADEAARAVADEFMFGSSLLVAPVTTHQARSRAVYLPKGIGRGATANETVAWYDLWTGEPAAGGTTVTAPAPFDAIPVYARAGAIVPFGPDLQYVAEKPADPITVFVYAGADGAFDLYEDEGTTNGYERGAFATIPMRWNDAAGTLTIGARAGSFPGMLASRTFKVVLVRRGAPAGYTTPALRTKSVTYSGAAVDVALR